MTAGIRLARFVLNSVRGGEPGFAQDIHPGGSPMRIAIVLAVALTAGLTTAAQAESWCGYAVRANSVIECGYTSVAECETAVGKGGMCFVDPNTAALSRPHMPVGVRRLHTAG
jgi:hypothetical protein